MIYYILSSNYDTIYDFATTVNSLYYTKEYVRHELPTREIVEKWTTAICESLKALLKCHDSIKANAKAESSDDMVVRIEKMNSLTKSAYCDLVSERVVGKTTSINFYAYNRSLCARIKGLHTLIKELESIVSREKHYCKNPLESAYIKALELFTATILRESSFVDDDLRNC